MLRTQRETYRLEATAQDKGYPPLSRSVEVQIDVVDRANNPPVWDHVVYGPIYIRENHAVGGKVISVKARSVPFSRDGWTFGLWRKTSICFTTHLPEPQDSTTNCPLSFVNEDIVFGLALIFDQVTISFCMNWKSTAFIESIKEVFLQNHLNVNCMCQCKHNSHRHDTLFYIPVGIDHTIKF